MGVRKRRDSEGRRYKGRTRSTEKMEKRRSSDTSTWDSIFKREFPVFKAKEGKNIIRIISPDLVVPDPKNPKKDVIKGWVDADYWGKDIYVHQNVGSGFSAYLCLQKMKNEPCPVCEERERARQEDDDSEDAKQYIKSLYPTHRVLVYIVDRKSDEPEVLVWSMPRVQMDQAIAKIAVDDDGSDIPVDCPEEGRDIHFEFGKDKKSGRYGYSGVRLAYTPSEVEDEFLDFVAENPLPDVLQFYSYEHILKVHNGASKPTDTEDEDIDDDEIDTSSKSDDLTYKDVLNMSPDDLEAILEEESKLDYDEIDAMSIDDMVEAVAELRGLHPPKKEETAEKKAKDMRRRRRSRG